MKAKFMHVTIWHFTILEEFYFLVTANEIEPCVAERMRVQLNFRGVNSLQTKVIIIIIMIIAMAIIHFMVLC